MAREWPEEWPDTKKHIANEISKDGTITIAKLIPIVQKGKTTIKKYLAELQKEGYLKRIGSDFNGHWEIIK